MRYILRYWQAHLEKMLRMHTNMHYIWFPFLPLFCPWLTTGAYTHKCLALREKKHQNDQKRNRKGGSAELSPAPPPVFLIFPSLSFLLSIFTLFSGFLLSSTRSVAFATAPPPPPNPIHNRNVIIERNTHKNGIIPVRVFHPIYYTISRRKRRRRWRRRKKEKRGCKPERKAKKGYDLTTANPNNTHTWILYDDALLLPFLLCVCVSFLLLFFAPSYSQTLTRSYNIHPICSTHSILFLFLLFLALWLLSLFSFCSTLLSGKNERWSSSRHTQPSIYFGVCCVLLCVSPSSYGIAQFLVVVVVVKLMLISLYIYLLHFLGYAAALLTILNSLFSFISSTAPSGCRCRTKSFFPMCIAHSHSPCFCCFLHYR